MLTSPPRPNDRSAFALSAGAWTKPIGRLANELNKLQRLRPVPDNFDVVADLGLLQGTQGQFQVLRIVFNEQYFNGVGLVHIKLVVGQG